MDCMKWQLLKCVAGPCCKFPAALGAPAAAAAEAEAAIAAPMAVSCAIQAPMPCDDRGCSQHMYVEDTLLCTYRNASNRVVMGNAHDLEEIYDICLHSMSQEGQCIRG